VFGRIGARFENRDLDPSFSLTEYQFFFFSKISLLFLRGGANIKIFGKNGRLRLQKLPCKMHHKNIFVTFNIELPIFPPKSLTKNVRDTLHRRLDRKEGTKNLLNRSEAETLMRGKRKAAAALCLPSSGKVFGPCEGGLKFSVARWYIFKFG
jgi:hypothetical protein